VLSPSNKRREIRFVPFSGVHVFVPNAARVRPSSSHPTTPSHAQRTVSSSSAKMTKPDVDFGDVLNRIESEPGVTGIIVMGSDGGTSKPG